jgi:hypothetical protein
MSVSSDPAASSSDAQAAFEAAPSQEAPPREDQAPTESSPSVLPIPIGKLRSDLTPPKDAQARPSFWRRIAFRKRRPETSSTGSETEISTRLEAIERALEQFAGNVHGQLEVLTGRLDDVWESEEQLSQLAEIQGKLDELTQAHASLSMSLASSRRTLVWLAALVAVAGAGFALNLIF